VADHYKAPDWFTRHVFNPLVAGLTRLGVGVYGSRVLEVQGRKSGEWRRTPVNLLTVGDVEYLVAPRGHTQWVRNMRVAGGGRLILGRRVREIRTTELADADKPPILRAYLKKWAWETKQFFEGVSADSGEDELLRIAPDHPVFRLEPS
jgi:deazaflavin-dependent oxidoreductase (nitroreductase family)